MFKKNSFKFNFLRHVFVINWRKLVSDWHRSVVGLASDWGQTGVGLASDRRRTGVGLASDFHNITTLRLIRF